MRRRIQKYNIGRGKLKGRMMVARKVVVIKMKERKERA